MSWQAKARGGYPVLSVWTSTKDRWPLQGTLKMSENTDDIRWCSWNRNGRCEGDHIESEYDLIPIEPEPVKQVDRHKDVGPIPKGFRLLGDELRLASDCYWSYHDWILIGGLVEIANRDKWPALRFVVDKPELVKHFVVVNDQDNEQALYVNGKLEDIDHPIYGYNIAEAANGCKIRIESREVVKPDDEWPTKLSELIIVDKEQPEDPSGEWEPKKDEIEYAMDRCGVPASVFGSNPIEVRPIMQIRLPVPASVLGKLGDMLEKHYPGSTTRQVGGYLVFDEPIES